MRVRLANHAVADLADLTEYLLLNAPSAAQKTINRIERAWKLLKAHPMAGRKSVVRNGRKVAVPRTNYVLHYSIRGQTIWVNRILHGARRWPRTSDSDE